MFSEGTAEWPATGLETRGTVGTVGVRFVYPPPLLEGAAEVVGTVQLPYLVGGGAGRFRRACAKPARTRSRRISRSNSGVDSQASRSWLDRPTWSDPAPRLMRRNRRRDAPAPGGPPEGPDRPQRSSRHTSAMSISRRGAASSSFSRLSRREAPAPIFFDLQSDPTAVPVRNIERFSSHRRSSLPRWGARPTLATLVSSSHAGLPKGHVALELLLEDS